MSKKEDNSEIGNILINLTTNKVIKTKYIFLNYFFTPFQLSILGNIKRNQQSRNQQLNQKDLKQFRIQMDQLNNNNLCKIEEHFNKEKDQFCLSEECNYARICLYCRINQHSTHNVQPIQTWQKQILGIKSPSSIQQQNEGKIDYYIKELRKDLLIKANSKLENTEFYNLYQKNSQLLNTINSESIKNIDSQTIQILTQLHSLYVANIPLFSIKSESELKNRSEIVNRIMDQLFDSMKQENKLFANLKEIEFENVNYFNNKSNISIPQEEDELVPIYEDIQQYSSKVQDENLNLNSIIKQLQQENEENQNQFKEKEKEMENQIQFYIEENHNLIEKFEKLNEKFQLVLMKEKEVNEKQVNQLLLLNGVNKVIKIPQNKEISSEVLNTLQELVLNNLLTVGDDAYKKRVSSEIDDMANNIKNILNMQD